MECDAVNHPSGHRAHYRSSEDICRHKTAISVTNFRVSAAWIEIASKGRRCRLRLNQRMCRG